MTFLFKHIVKIIFFSLGLITTSYASTSQGECLKYLSGTSDGAPNQKREQLMGADFFHSFEKAFSEVQKIKMVEPTIEDLKKLKSPSKLMTVLKKIYQIGPEAFNFILWLPLERKIFDRPELENPVFVKQVESVYDQYIEEFKKAQIGPLYSIISKGKMGVVDAKKNLAKYLKRYELLLSLTYGEPINLFDESGWVKVYNLNSLSELSSKIEQNYLENRELHSRIKNILTLSGQPEALFNTLIEEFFDVTQGTEFRNDARGFLIRNVNRPLVEELIVELRLGERLEKKYLDQIETMSKLPTNKHYRISLGYCLLVFRAYLETHEHILGFTNLPKKVRTFSPQTFISLKNTLLYKKMLRAIEDEKYSEYINRSEILNMRRSSLEEKIFDLKTRYPQFQDEILKLEISLQKILEINDFDNDLDFIENEINDLEVRRDLLTEKILETINKENIVHFEDLNYRWERLLPEKTYMLKGIDYNSIVFSKNVIEHFEYNMVVGARFLAALSKSYVAIKKASGLRKLQNIHEDFRDIKLIKTGSKIRIVGKLVGKTIYFFYVYEEDKPYDGRAIGQLVEKYRPA